MTLKLPLDRQDQLMKMLPTLLSIKGPSSIIRDRFDFFPFIEMALKLSPGRQDQLMKMLPTEDHSLSRERPIFFDLIDMVLPLDLDKRTQLMEMLPVLLYHFPPSSDRRVFLTLVKRALSLSLDRQHQFIEMLPTLLSTDGASSFFLANGDVFNALIEKALKLSPDHKRQLIRMLPTLLSTTTPGGPKDLIKEITNTKEENLSGFYLLNNALGEWGRMSPDYSRTPNTITLKTVRALLFMRPLPEVDERESLISKVFDIDLTSPLFLPEPPDTALIAAYSVVMDVHSDQRDKKTREAYDILLARRSLKDTEIEKAIGELKEFVRNKDEENNRDLRVLGNPEDLRASQTLMGGVEGVPALPGDWKSLLSGEEGGLFNGSSTQVIPDATLMASLWCFIEGLEEREKAIAKDELISALRDCVDGGNLICNPGKYQQLALRILQGRLPGVMIDEANDVEAAPLAGGGAGAGAGAGVPDAPTIAPQRAYVRNLGEISHHLKLLERRWMNRPHRDRVTAIEFFQSVFDYLIELEEAHIFLDPRDVVFYLLYGVPDKEINPAYSFCGALGDVSEGFKIEFDLQEYINKYGKQEVAAQREAMAEAERQRLRA